MVYKLKWKNKIYCIIHELCVKAKRILLPKKAFYLALKKEQEL